MRRFHCMAEPSPFARAAQWASCQAGRSWAFITAVGVVLAWAVTGPVFGFSDTWQLVINTGTTIITFLMVFLIQHAQNRDTQAIHVKLDELIRATKGAHNRLIALEDQSEEELAAAREELRRVADAGNAAVEQAKRLVEAKQ
ncbi:low affinity iron permease family protein [Dankookia sp. P2]|uniref:low affinity iron permease family protein n=1 Tax=Dankookia sp. P2 TaxID=3423955 RepID=UPI003D669D4F